MKFSEELQNEVLNEYVNLRMTPTLISKKHNLCDQAIYRMLKRKGVTFGKSNIPLKYKYSIDETYFDNIDFPDKAYFLGLIAADGQYASDSNKHLFLGQVESDKEVLESFLKYTKSNYPIKIVDRSKEGPNQQNKALLRITNPRFTQNLENLGIHNNKSFTVTIPELRVDLYSHYIRGFFDGDGCMYLSEKNNRLFRASFDGPDKYILHIKELLERFGGMQGGNLYRKLLVDNTQVWTSLGYGGRNQIKNLFKYLYEGTDPSLRLNRKYLKMKKVVDYQGDIRENMNTSLNKGARQSANRQQNLDRYTSSTTH